jgi:hypothetical protein
MFCEHGDGGPVVEAMQRLGLAAGGSLPRFGADGGYGDETAAMVRALGLGGDGKVYGPTQYAALMAKIGALGGGAIGPAGPRGAAGERGPAGPVGERGPRGERGETGTLPIGAKLVVAEV